MSNHSRDPIVNVVYQQIKESIKLCIEYNHLSAAVKLIYSGIDTMAYIGMPRNKQDVTRPDFITWVEQYIRFEGKEQLSGLDVYGARCSMLHNHSVYSKLSRDNKCRLIGYADKMFPPVKAHTTKNFVLVSVPALAGAFFTGTDKYLIDLFSDPNKKLIAEQRLETLVQNIPISDKSN